MNDAKDVKISVNMTPNPDSLQFLTEKELIPSGSFDFPDADSAQKSRLAASLFKIEGVAGVLIGSRFVTVTKQSGVEWQQIADQISEVLKQELSSSEPLVEESLQSEASSTLGETAVQIKRILDDEIRPAVARDGGDIIFDSYEDGVVRLHLQGACSSCPSSVMTLKAGIENRLKQVIPEIKEVVAV